MADIALAGRVISSHYAEPVERSVMIRVLLRRAPSEDAEALSELSPGEPFSMLDESLGWSWGYGGKERRVGYVRAEAIG